MPRLQPSYPDLVASRARPVAPDRERLPIHIGQSLILGTWIAWLGVFGAGLACSQPPAVRAVARLLKHRADLLSGPFSAYSAVHAAGYYKIPGSPPAHSPVHHGDGDGLIC